MYFKRIFTGVLCAAVVASSVAAPASAALKHSGYDLSALTEGMGIVGEYFTEYVDGEEHDAKKACGGLYYGTFQIDTNTGEILYSSFDK